MIDNNESNINNEIYNIDSNNKNDINEAKEDLYFIDKHTSLQAIALQYDSTSSDDDNITEIITKKVSNNKDYRNKHEVVLSSDESSDNESDSSSESGNHSENSRYSYSNSKDNNDDSDCENHKSKKKISKKVFKPKGEFDNLPPIEDLTISVPEVLCDPIGMVAWTVEQMVVVRPKPGKPTLNLDTVLFIEKGQRALGHIFDVFGQVTEPYYCVRFNSANHILESYIKVGMIVYYCPNSPYTSIVFLNELIKMKAIDELGDNEPPQFSDDEEEQAYLASIKANSNSDKLKETTSEMPNKRKRDWQSNHPWNSKTKNQINTNPQKTKPFYRSQHPWSRTRYQQQNMWSQYNTVSYNQWTSQNPSYNEIESCNKYLGPMHVQEMGIQNTRFPQMQWIPHYQLPQTNVVPLQGFPQTLVPLFTLPPPPPPPPLPPPPPTPPLPPPPQNANK